MNVCKGKGNAIFVAKLCWVAILSTQPLDQTYVGKPRI